MADKKLLLGPKVRRLRTEQRLTQAQMAADLTISPAYLNLIEHNQRPVSAQVLVKIAAAYDIDLAEFAKDDSQERAAQFREVFADPALGDLTLSAQDYRDMTDLSPEAGAAILALGQRVGRQRRLLQAGTDADPIRSESDPIHGVQDFFERHQNHFPDLEDLADQVRDDLGLRVSDRGAVVGDALAGASPYAVQVMPAAVMGSTVRRHDLHGRRLLLNQALSLPSRRFQIATQYFLSLHGLALERLIKAEEWTQPAAAKIAHMALASYAAAAILMPYTALLKAAKDKAYDIDALAHEFAVSREQLAQRLTALQRQGQRGLRFALARLDGAGQVTKALGMPKFPRPRSGGICPRWQSATSVLPSAQIAVEAVEMPDGHQLLCLSIPCKKPTLSHDQPGQDYRLILACDLDQAQATVYGAPQKSPTPIGPGCRLCERPNCTYRAVPPANHEILVDENRQDLTLYAFA